MNTGTANNNGNHLSTLANLTAVVIRKPQNMPLIKACGHVTNVLDCAI